jgi:hypothetical protein
VRGILLAIQRELFINIFSSSSSISGWEEKLSNSDLIEDIIERVFFCPLYVKRGIINKIEKGI